MTGQQVARKLPDSMRLLFSVRLDLHRQPHADIVKPRLFVMMETESGRNCSAPARRAACARRW